MADVQFNPTTPLWFYQLTSTYTPGEGQTEAWALVLADPLYCEWTGGYGAVAIEAATRGINDFATVKTFYHPTIYTAAQTQRIVVVRNSITNALADGIPNASNPNVYELWGAIDNIKMENQKMEFKAKRFEGV